MTAADSWYAIYTKFQHEKAAASLLEKKNFEVFLPVYRTVNRWKDRNQLVILPLFPCYLFLRMTLERKIDALRTAGVRSIIENAGYLCAVPDAEIEAVRKICAVGTRVQPYLFVKQGDQVRVSSGPLAGTEGILLQVKNTYRVVISIELLQRSVAVEVELSNVEPLSTIGVTAPVPPFATQRSSLSTATLAR